MFDHVTIRVSSRLASEQFYETVLRTLGIEQSHSGEQFAEWDDFSLAAADDEHGVTRGLHVGFVARSHAHVDEFWRAGTQAGFRPDGAPGRRPQYRDDYYGAFLLDPDGNSAEAVHHGALRVGGGIDHLWIRVADVAASKRFYETVAPHAGFRLQMDTAERAQFVGETGSFSVVAGPPAENVHLAFPVAENANRRRLPRRRARGGLRRQRRARRAADLPRGLLRRLRARPRRQQRRARQAQPRGVAAVGYIVRTAKSTTAVSQFESPASFTTT